MAGRGSSAAVGGPARHIPVMLSEVVAALDPKDGDVVVDGTFGAGGYSEAILSSADCKVVAIDRDPDAFRLSRELADKYPGRPLAVLGRFSEMETIAASEASPSMASCLISASLPCSSTGPSAAFPSCRTDRSTCAWALSDRRRATSSTRLPEAALADIIGKLGEEQRRAQSPRPSWRGAQSSRSRRPASSLIRSQGSRPQARRDQAPRDPDLPGAPALSQRELTELAHGLAAAERLLEDKGRLAIVTFHSLEDRIAKVPRQPQRAAAARLAPPPEPPAKFLRQASSFLTVVR